MWSTAENEVLYYKETCFQARVNLLGGKNVPKPLNTYLININSTSQMKNNQGLKNANI